jgi:hypothetical protein
MSGHPPLTPLHDVALLSSSKLAIFERLDTDVLKRSLALDQEHCLKARPDGTMLDGHHRIHVLRLRQVDVDASPREIIVPEQKGEDEL